MVAEDILAADADLVILPAWADATIRALLAHEGVPTIVLGAPSSIEEVADHVRELGARTAERERADALVADMHARLGAVRASVRGRERVRLLRWSWSGHAPAQGTLFCEVVEVAGGTCAASEGSRTGYAPLGVEDLFAIDPDSIVMDRYRADGRAREIVPERALEDDPRFASLRAVRTGRVVEIPGPHLLATSHHVAALAEDLAAALHAAGPASGSGPPPPASESGAPRASESGAPRASESGAPRASGAPPPASGTGLGGGTPAAPPQQTEPAPTQETEPP
jgi:iron complex transport system substrate-binding protein